MPGTDRVLHDIVVTVLQSKRAWVQPLDFLVVQGFDQYFDERLEKLGAGGSDFLLVNLFGEPLGAPMPPSAMGELFARLSERAGLGRKIGPHMARRAFGSNVVDAGGSWDEVQMLLGQEHPGSVAPYDPGPQPGARGRRAGPLAVRAG
ncbi:site-specific integrase [Streptomyces spinoverrucosus]|uniref:site-specific integrase n=1 Tax=Streptomyces spinoverrucosus TaxID=284043 RepID=UPI00142E97DD|nr:site-specific integrase [Streptomyces spinoverrucosus]